MTRRLAVWIVLLVILVALVVQAAAASGGASSSVAGALARDGVTYDGTVVQEGEGDARVAMVPFVGTLVDGDTGAGGGTTGGDDIVRMLDAIADDEDSWDGVILELDTPGGSVLAAAEIHDAIERFKQETDLPIVAWMRGTAASAGYYVSAPTDRIVAAPSTFTGSIGVILEYYVVQGLADDLGVEAVTIKSGKLKDIGNPFRKATAQERAVFQAAIDEAYAEFVRVVSEGRGIPEGEVRRLADGRFYTGRQAKDLDLVDELGLQRTAFDAVGKLMDDRTDGADIQVVRFSRTFGFFESLSAGVQPSLDTVAAARTVGKALSGDGRALAASPGAIRTDAGVARLEYRAVVG